MKIGSFGGLVFEVSEERILSFETLSRSVSARVETHEIGGRQGIVEFVGPGDDSITLDMSFSRQRGVDPKTEVDRLIGYCKTGQRFPLLIGGEPMGGAGALWIPRDVSEERSVVSPRGVTIRSRVSVSLGLAPNAPVVVASSGKVAKKGVVRRRS